MSSVPEIEVVHTSGLDPRRRADARTLLYDVFDDMTEPDWDHCLGGMHALAVEDGVVVAHAALVARRIGHRGHPWRTGYIEGVAVRPDRRGRGLGAAVMDPLERMIADAYELGALAATRDGARFYAARGWTKWTGRTWALTPAGTVRTPDEDDCVFVRPGSVPLDRLDLDGDLIADWRDDCPW
ncbi:MAG: GNAT family N-acetyltransferase [Nakamurella sp.]